MKPALLAISLCTSVFAGEVLYNGIELPTPWPPATPVMKAGEPMPVPYLAKPPAVIPIDVGRQLFTDDFLIGSTTLTRKFHLATLYPGNPVLKPDQPPEFEGKAPMAMPFSDGVWFDPGDRLFKMWYMAGYGRQTAYATSRDGLHWEKPALDVRPGTNVVQKDARDSSTVWLDLEESDPQRRFKMWRSHSEDKRFGLSLHFSADGIHWNPRALRTGSCGDRTTVFWNPFRKVWVYSLRHGWGVPRARRYWEVKDLLASPQWSAITEPVMWTGADRLDPPREDLGDAPQLYNLDGVAYESVMLGLFTIWRGDKNIPPGRPKPNSVWLGFSRDGFHWDRPDRHAFIPVSEKQGDWNWGNVQSVGGGCLVVGDELWFYFSGRAGVGPQMRDGNGATGLAKLRRDGFASMESGAGEGTLTTRPLRFSGKQLFVNLAAPQGELRAEVLDKDGKVIAPFTKENSITASGDKTLLKLNWKDGGDLSKLAGESVRFRFHLRNGALYSFWVSPDESGASRGYVAAGGPGFPGPTDTVGTTANANATKRQN
ncbi:MAG: glycosyl hydrolase family 32 [Chthoniobacteraceae bacterium]